MKTARGLPKMREALRVRAIFAATEVNMLRRESVFFRKPFVFWIFSQQCRVPFSQEFRFLNATSLRCVEADCSVTFCFSLLWRCISCYSSRIKTQGLVGQFLGQSRLLTIWISKILYFNIGSGSREGSPPLVRAHAVTKSIASTDDFWWGLYYEARTPEGATAYPCAGVHRIIFSKWRDMKSPSVWKEQPQDPCDCAHRKSLPHHNFLHFRRKWSTPC